MVATSREENREVGVTGVCGSAERESQDFLKKLPPASTLMLPTCADPPHVLDQPQSITIRRNIECCDGAESRIQANGGGLSR